MAIIRPSSIECRAAVVDESVQTNTDGGPAANDDYPTALAVRDGNVL